MKTDNEIREREQEKIMAETINMFAEEQREFVIGMINLANCFAKKIERAREQQAG